MESPNLILSMGILSSVPTTPPLDASHQWAILMTFSFV
jgi:hypothetical protein